MHIYNKVLSKKNMPWIGRALSQGKPHYVVEIYSNSVVWIKVIEWPILFFFFSPVY